MLVYQLSSLASYSPLVSSNLNVRGSNLEHDDENKSGNDILPIEVEIARFILRMSRSGGEGAMGNFAGENSSKRERDREQAKDDGK